MVHHDLPKNISFDRTRNVFRVEMRVLPKHNRTRRVRTLEEACALREHWAKERDALREERGPEEKTAKFSVHKKPVTLTFD